MSDDTKDRDDPAHQTMPPELRPFAKPEPQQPLVAPEGEARFNAAIGALKLLNGGPAADPFYVDPKNDPALADRKAPESVRAYSPPTALPAAEAKVRRAAPAKVVIAEAGQPPLHRVDQVCEEIDLRPIREALEAEREAKAGKTAVEPAAAGGADVVREEGGRAESEAPKEKSGSPWAKEEQAHPVEGTALPSSLRPQEPHRAGADASETTQPSLRRLAPVPSPTRRITVAILVVLLVAAAVISLWALMTRGPTENATHGPTRTTTASVPVPPVSAVAPAGPTASAEDRVPPLPPSTTTSAAAAPTVAPTPDRPRQTSKRPQKGDDPYGDAGSASRPAVTAAPTVAPVAPPPAPTPPPTAPAATQTAFGGTRVFGN